MSLVDRWLARSPQSAWAATSATSPENPSSSAELSVASELRHTATSPQAPTPSPPVSQSVADGLRRENPQNSAACTPLSQLSQLSQGSSPEASSSPTMMEELTDRGIRRLEANLVAPVTWYEHLVSTAVGEPPHDQPCPARRGRVERAGAIFLHYCVTCGAWGSFGYGVTRGRPGRWYCGKHPPSEGQR
jgi:hypothetical protein